MNDDDYKLEKGDKYILIDAGGGTVDIACHEIIDEFGVKEIYHPSGGKWGSTYIDDQYIKLLQRIFSVDWLNEFKKTAENEYVHLIHNFQQAKQTFYTSKYTNQHNVDLTQQFCSFIAKKLKEKFDIAKDGDLIREQLGDCDEGNYFECFVENVKWNNRNNLFENTDTYLQIDYSVWKKLFDFVVDPIMNHVKYLLTNIPLLMSKNLKYICLVGGLSNSKYFQYKIKEEFGLRSKYKLDIIIPHKPILCVVEGAALLGITPNFVRARKLRKSYGICMDLYPNYARKMGICEDYIERNTQYDGYVGNCFKLIAQKNEEVYVNTVKKDVNERRSVYSYVPILCSNKENPLVADDGRMLANLLVQCDENDLNTQIVTEFHFYDTLLKAYSYPENKPENKKEVEITYQE